MGIDRRGFLSGAVRIAAAGATASLMPSVSLALTEDEAMAHVRETINEVAALVDSPGDVPAKAPKLLEIMNRRAAMPQIARFAAGRAWRSMDKDQQARFTAAFGKFISGLYAGRFQQYSGDGNAAESFIFNGAIDAGRKGMLVKTTIIRTGDAPVKVDWLVSDRPGRVVIADIVIEGVSMLVSEREEIASMLEARNGDVEKLIADLSA